jgi:hypothetical protein
MGQAAQEGEVMSSVAGYPSFHRLVGRLHSGYSQIPIYFSPTSPVIGRRIGPGLIIVVVCGDG